jgi:endonuclease/exonuclease/phosphatase (EEP) superfamily protein YafD
MHPEPPRIAAASRRNRWWDALARRARIITVLCALGLLLPWITRALAGQDHRVAWALDLAAHWQWLYAAGLLLGSLVAARSWRRWLLALVLLPLPWWSAAPRLPEAAKDAGPVLTIASANVQVGHRDATAVVDWLATTDADVVVLVEVSPVHAAALTALPGYPHRHVVAADDPFGIAVLSRHPMQAVTMRDHDGIARIESRIAFAGTCTDLVALHPMPPLSPHFHAARDALLKEIADRDRTDERPMLVVGDLNATPWSSAFAGLDHAGLRRSSDLRPTWPSAGRGWIGIPIDHVLASPHWARLSSAAGPDLASDHRPLLTSVALVQRGASDCR